MSLKDMVQMERFEWKCIFYLHKEEALIYVTEFIKIVFE